jgi:hypothetical protein
LATTPSAGGAGTRQDLRALVASEVDLKRIAADTKAPPAAQVAAAVALLDRGWGRPRQALELGIRRTMDDMSDDELLTIVNGVDDQKLVN